MWLLKALMVVERFFPGVDFPLWLRAVIEVALIGAPIALIAHYVGGRSGDTQPWSGSVAAGTGVGLIGMLISEWTIRRNRD